MRKRDGDLFAAWVGDADYATVIATNGSVDKTMRAHMKSGDAKKAAEMWPEIPRALGKLLDTCGNHVFVLPVTRQPRAWVVSFPVRATHQSKPDLKLIERSAGELVALTDAYRWDRVFMNRPGCDNIQTDWTKHVRPILRAVFDDRFTVCFDSKVERRLAKKRSAQKRPLSTRMGD